MPTEITTRRKSQRQPPGMISHMCRTFLATTWAKKSGTKAQWYEMHIASQTTPCGLTAPPCGLTRYRWALCVKCRRFCERRDQSSPRRTFWGRSAEETATADASTTPAFPGFYSLFLFYPVMRLWKSSTVFNLTKSSKTLLKSRVSWTNSITSLLQGAFFPLLRRTSLCVD